jgi:hypothetical protein
MKNLDGALSQAGLAWAVLLRPVGAQIGASSPHVQQKMWEMRRGGYPYRKVIRGL